MVRFFILFILFYLKIKIMKFNDFFYLINIFHTINLVDLDCNNGIVNKLQVILLQTIEKFEEEKKKSQDKNQLYNNLQEKYAVLTDKEEASQHQLREIVEKYAQLENIAKLQEQKIDQLQQSMKLKENQLQHSEKENQKNVNLMNQLENKIKLQEQEIDQLQQSMKSKENQSEKENQKNVNLKNQLENKIKLQEQKIDQLQQSMILKENQLQHSEKENQKNVNLMNQLENKIKLQEQKIDQLQQSMKLKDDQLQNAEEENDNLYQKNVNLMDQLENLLQNSLLDDELSNYQSEDTNQNYIMNINNDISELNDNLKKYITDVKQDVIVNIEGIKNLLLLYKCPTKITNQDDDWLHIQVILQRHIIEIIISHATEYFQSTGQPYHLESDIIKEASLLSTLLTNISKYHTGNNKIAHKTSTKLREQIYLTLGDCGFNNINGENNTTYEHPFIADCKKELNNTINELRIVKDQEKKIAAENLAATIICEVIKIFWFRIKACESVVQYVWIPCNVKVDKIFMEISNIDDDENLYVDLCYFPLIGSDLTSIIKKFIFLQKLLYEKINSKFYKINKI
jgi:hypothetical protein